MKPEPEPVDLEKWNRALVSDTVDVLVDTKAKVEDAIGRLRGFLAVNPGGPVCNLAPPESEIPSA